MQREREGRSDSTHFGSSLFDSFGAFGTQRSMMSSIFGGRDPFDDSFFTRPFGSLFDSSGPVGLHVSESSQPIIQELNSDDESGIEEEPEEEETNGTSNRSTKDKPTKSKKSSKEPLVEHPDDQDNEVKSKDLQLRSNYNRRAEMKPQNHSVSYRKVTYGGINGTYYTATTTRRTGGDGVVLEESKQADKTTGQAAHRISKGIHDKGHTLTRKLDADGRVDTMQTLHNLNEDELVNFERDWNGNIERRLPRRDNETSSSGNPGAGGSEQSVRAATDGWGVPVSKFVGRDSEGRANSCGARPKKIVTINID